MSDFGFWYAFFCIAYIIGEIWVRTYRSHKKDQRRTDGIKFAEHALVAFAVVLILLFFLYYVVVNPYPPTALELGLNSLLTLVAGLMVWRRCYQ